MPRFFRRQNRNRSKPQDQPTIGQIQAQSETEFLTTDLQKNLAKLRDLFGNSADLVIREFSIGDTPGIKGAIVQLEGLVDSKFVASELLSTLMTRTHVEEAPRRHHSTLNDLYAHALTATQVRKEQRLSAIGSSLPIGDTLLLIDGEKTGLICSTQGFEHRAVQEPQSESGVRVPREGFTEVLAVNRSLTRRRIRDPRLRFEQMQIGTLTQTMVHIAYIHGLASGSLVEEVRKRLQRIQIDGIFETGYLEAFISDNPNSIFPVLRRTERPDTVASGLVEGRVAIFVDGTPFVMTAPVTLPEMLHASEDYYVHWALATFIRCFRYLGYAIAMFAPAFYIALVNFHPEMIPTSLLHNVAASREGVPFPAVIEALVMLSVFEALREAGIRLPRIVGSAMTIVGALVLGDQTINAGLASPAMVVVVAGTAIASFSIPSYGLDASSRILRFAYVIAAALLGLFGIFILACLVGMHLCALRSFGVPYLAPFAPLYVNELSDTVYKAPWWTIQKRPRYIPTQDSQRQDPDPKPRTR